MDEMETLHGPKHGTWMRFRLDRGDRCDRLQEERLTHGMRMCILTMKTLWLD